MKIPIPKTVGYVLIGAAVVRGYLVYQESKTTGVVKKGPWQIALLATGGAIALMGQG